MILDTSALAAILFGEPEAALFTQLIHAADRCNPRYLTLFWRRPPETRGSVGFFVRVLSGHGHRPGSFTAVRSLYLIAKGGP